MAADIRPKTTKLFRFVMAMVATGLAHCGDTSNDPSPAHVDFLVAVNDQVFTLRLTDPDAIAAAQANFRGQNTQFPIGPFREGNGGFNAPWSWHIDPAGAQMTEIAIEVCDGEPNYVEAHVQDYLQVGSYCPWGGRIVGVRP
jgi:hypothetical protein